MIGKLKVLVFVYMHVFKPDPHPSLLKKEIFRPNSFRDLDEVKEQLGGFLFDYNHLRRHGGLNYMTPFDKLQKVTELVR